MSSINNETDRGFKSNFRIVIVGAGLVGLALAALLQKQGFQTIVLEQDESLKEVGAGISLPVNTCKVLQQLGILEEIKKVAICPPCLLIHSYRDNRILDETKLNPFLEEKYGAPWLTIHRADLREILYGAARQGRASIRLGVKVDWQKSVINEGLLICEDWQKFEADLVIAADGEHSQARTLLARKQPVSRSIGKVVDRVLVSTDVMMKNGLNALLQPPNVHYWFGPEILVVTYQLKGVFNVAVVRPSASQEREWRSQPLSQSQLAELCADWEPQIRKLINFGEGFLEWGLTEPVERLRSWIHPSKRMILIGDSSDVYLPYIAQGAAMGFESASVLSHLLSKVDKHEDVPKALEIWEELRLPRMTRVVEATKQAGEDWMMPNGPEQAARDARLESGQSPTPGHPSVYGDPVFQPWLFGKDLAKEADERWEAKSL